LFDSLDTALYRKTKALERRTRYFAGNGGLERKRHWKYQSACF